jgi:hypothetical protein
MILMTSLTLSIAYFLDWVDLGTFYVPLSTVRLGSLWTLCLTNKEITSLKFESVTRAGQGNYKNKVPWPDVLKTRLFNGFSP